MIWFVEDLFGDNFVDCIDCDIFVVEFCDLVVFFGVLFGWLMSVLLCFMEEMK